MANCERLEAQPGAKCVCSGRADKEQILVANAKFAFAIDGRLVAHDHSGRERNGIEILSYVVRALVNTEEVAYTVSGTVTEVAFVAP